MSGESWRERISVDPEVCHGKPCIKGTRIMVSVILNWIADQESNETILANYPAPTPEDIQAALSYAAWLAHEEEDIPLRSDLIR